MGRDLTAKGAESARGTMELNFQDDRSVDSRRRFGYAQRRQAAAMESV
jgi:hypothetical protein